MSKSMSVLQQTIHLFHETGVIVFLDGKLEFVRLFYTGIVWLKHIPSGNSL